MRSRSARRIIDHSTGNYYDDRIKAGMLVVPGAGKMNIYNKNMNFNNNNGYSSVVISTITPRLVYRA